MRRVLVTRPLPDAGHTADKLAELGLEPVLLPLTRIEPVQPEIPPQEASFGAVAVTSANAVRHAPFALLKQIASVPVFAVGRKTGRAARQAGLRVADEDAGDAAILLERIVAAVPSGTRVLLLCGRVRRGILEPELTRAGLGVTVVATYDTLPSPPSAREFEAALGGTPIDAVLLYSAFAAEIAVSISEDALFSDASYFAISARVAKVLPEKLQDRVHVAREPTEEGMLSVLAGHL